MRYLSKSITRDLKKKMIILSGPRQSGKTTLAKSLLKKKVVYLNWDIRNDQRMIRNIGWPKDADLVVLDELHKYPKWKNFLKGVVDDFQNKPSLLITGSAKLETVKHEGDALTGRYYSYHLHPIDISEASLFLPKLSKEKRLEHLLQTGGFPEAFLNLTDAERLRNDRFDLVLQEDLRDLSKSNALNGLKLLIEILRERGCGQLNYSNLAGDLKVSAPTVKTWIELLERLYLLFLIYPYSRGLARSLRKEPKFYFFDCAAGYDSYANGVALENSVACSLLKYCHYQRDIFGKKFGLNYFRDREKREVDFVITLNGKALYCIEVKKSDDNLSSSLSYLHKRLQPKASIQLVQFIEKPKEIKGIKICSLPQWLGDFHT